jgi:hypothetical protein
MISATLASSRLKKIPESEQGCQMVYFKTKNPNFGYILERLGLEKYWYILLPIETYFSHYVYFMAIW